MWLVVSTYPSEKRLSEFVSWDDFSIPTEWKVIIHSCSSHHQPVIRSSFNMIYRRCHLVSSNMARKSLTWMMFQSALIGKSPNGDASSSCPAVISRTYSACFTHGNPLQGWCPSHPLGNSLKFWSCVTMDDNGTSWINPHHGGHHGGFLVISHFCLLVRFVPILKNMIQSMGKMTSHTYIYIISYMKWKINNV